MNDNFGLAAFINQYPLEKMVKLLLQPVQLQTNLLVPSCTSYTFAGTQFPGFNT